MRPMGLVWPILGLLALVAVRGRIDVVVVRGRSMAPTLLPGDRLLVARVRPRTGDVVLAADPRASGRELIKRVAALDDAGVTLRGDNPAGSTDGRNFGVVPAETVAWRVVARYWPMSRVGFVPPAPMPLDPVVIGGEPACAFPDSLVAGE
jgi:nickel-type superoxide dismutase maturation protease